MMGTRRETSPRHAKKVSAELVRPCRDAGAEREGGLKVVHDGNAPRNFPRHAKYHGTYYPG